MRSSWSQSAPSLVFADSIELLHLCLQRIQSIWFYYWPSGDDHVCSLPLCCWKSMFAMTIAFSWQNSVSLCPVLFLFFLYSKVKFACYSRCFLTSYFCIPVPCNEKESVKWNGLEWVNLTPITIISTTYGQESLRRNGVAIMVNKRVWNAVLGYNLKNEWSLFISKANHSISQESKSMPQPVMLKKLKLNGSVKKDKTF